MMKIDKIMTIIIIIISVINIILVVLGYIDGVNQEGFFRLDDTCISIILLVAQCFNIVAIILKYIKGNLCVKGQRKILISVILIILVTAFIPVKREYTAIPRSIVDEANATVIERIYGSGGTKIFHKNLYGITIYEETEYLSSYT